MNEQKQITILENNLALADATFKGMRQRIAELEQENERLQHENHQLQRSSRTPLRTASKT